MALTVGAAIQSIGIGVGIIIVEELLNAIARRAAKRAGASRTVTRDLGYGLRLVAALAVITNFLNALGVASEFTALTVSGIAALAISIAFQTTLSNVVSGILMFYDGAIRLHDEVEFGGIKGKVVRIALRNTWIKTDSGKIVVVGNSSLSSGPLTNHSATERLSKKYAIE